MNNKTRILEVVFIVFLSVVGSILIHTKGVTVAMLFYGITILGYAFIWHKNKNWDLKEKYRDIKEAHARQRCSVFGLIFLGFLCLLCGVVTYFYENIMSVAVFCVIALLSVIPAYIIDRKFWAQVPREERPWAYRGMKSKENNPEEQ